MAKFIAEAASDKKARDIVLMNMIDLTPTTDYFVVCSAGSTTQVRAIADNIEEKLQEEAGIDFLHKEGYREGEWVLLDYGDCVAISSCRTAVNTMPWKLCGRCRADSL